MSLLKLNRLGFCGRINGIKKNNEGRDEPWMRPAT